MERPPDFDWLIRLLRDAAIVTVAIFLFCAFLLWVIHE